MNIWNRDFSEAPRDGSEVLICFVDQGQVLKLVRFNLVHGYWVSKGTPELGLNSQNLMWQEIVLPEQAKALEAGKGEG